MTKQVFHTITLGDKLRQLRDEKNLMQREVGAVIEDVKDYDLNPIKPFLKDDNTGDKVKTKNINILGFNYYSRKKSNTNN